MLNGVNYIAVLTLITAVLLGGSLSWKDGLTLGILACLIAAVKKKGYTHPLLIRACLVLPLMYLVVHAPPPVSATNMIQWPAPLFEWLHTVIALLGIVYTINLLRRMGSKGVPLQEIDILMLVAMLLLLLYGGGTLVLSRLLKLSVSLNPRVFMTVCSIALIFLFSEGISRIDHAWLKRLLCFVCLCSVLLSLYQGVHFVYLRNVMQTADNAERSGDFETARNTFFRLLEGNKTFRLNVISLHAYHHLGTMAYARGDFVKAVEYLTQALDIDERHNKSLFWLGVSLFAQHKTQQSRAYFTRFAQFNAPFDIPQLEGENAAGVYNLMGQAYFDLQRWKQCRQMLERAEQIGSLSGISEYLLGLLAEKQGDETEALARFHRALKKEYRTPHLFEHIAQLEDNKDREGRAIRALRQAIRLSPTNNQIIELGIRLAEKYHRSRLAENLRRMNNTITPQRQLRGLSTEHVELLGYTLLNQELKQGDDVIVLFYSKLKRDPTVTQEKIYYYLGTTPHVYVKGEFNLLQRMNRTRRRFFQGDIVISRCVIDGRTLIPGLCEIRFYLPGNEKLPPKLKYLDRSDVDVQKYQTLATVSILPKVHRRMSFNYAQLSDTLADGFDYRSVKAYFYLANKYKVDIPLLFPPLSFQSRSVVMISSLIFSNSLPQNTVLAKLTFRDTEGKQYNWLIKAGVDSSEWAWDSPGIRVVHDRAAVALSWTVFNFGREFEAHKYASRFTFPQPVSLASITANYLASSGCLEVCDLILEGRKIGLAKRPLTPINKGKNRKQGRINVRPQGSGGKKNDK